MAAKYAITILMILALIGISSPVCASPFLVCDWAEGVQSSEIDVNGTIVPGTVTQSGTKMILLDLAGYANGAYTFKARFIGTGGWPSDWSLPFSAVKPVGTGSTLSIQR